MLHPLKIALPAELVDPSSEEALRWIEELIITAEKQITGIERGPERMEAVVEVASQTLGGPLHENHAVVRIMCQLVYNKLAENLPPQFRTPKE